MLSKKAKLIALATASSLPYSFVAASILYEHGTVIGFSTTTEQFQIFHNASLLIENDRVTGLTEGALSSIPPNTTRLDATGRIIGPGYVDTHHHLWQTAFKTLGSNTTLADYVQKFGEYGPAVQNFTSSDIYLGQLVGSLELLHGGTTTVLDHAHAAWSPDGIDASVQGSHDSGVRTFYAHTLHVISNNFTWNDQISKLRALTTDPRFANNDLMHLGLAYDDFYGNTPENITEMWNIVRHGNLSHVTTHYMNGPWGWLNSVQLLDELGWLNTSVPVVFSHGAFLTAEDARLLRMRDQYISTTPESELHFGHNHPNIELIADQGSLGVDCHFTFSSSHIQQARLWLQSLRGPRSLKVLENWEIPWNNPMSVRQAYHLITRAGGLALRRPDLGILAVGSKADLVVYRGDSPNLLGWHDPIAALVLHSDVGDIEDVLVNGAFVKRGGKLLHPDWEGIKTRFLESAERIQRQWLEFDWPDVTSGPGFNDGFSPYGMADQIDTLRGNGTGY